SEIGFRNMSDVEEIKLLLSLCNPAQRDEVFRQLRQEFTLHPLDQELHAKAEIILEAIRRASGRTLRMIRGVIAEAAFGVEVVEQPRNLQSIPVTVGPANDVL